MPVTRLATRLLALPRSVKRLSALFIDASLCVASVWLAYGLRLDSWTFLSGVRWVPVLAAWLFALPLFIATGMYRAIFRYSGWGAMQAVGKALLIYAFMYAGLFSVVTIAHVPRTLGLIQPLLLAAMVGGSRIFARYWLGGLYRAGLARSDARVALIYGAGSAGRQLAALLASHAHMRAVGFVDDNISLQGHTINGLRVYRPAALAAVIERLGVTDLLLAMPSVSRARRNEILQTVQPLSLKVRTLPRLIDIAHGRVKTADIRELELEDLLGRDPVAPDLQLLNRNVCGKVVMVTGAGGSIGSELCRQILKVGPSTLLLVESSEFALYSVHQSLLGLQSQGTSPDARIIPLLASVRDYESIETIMRTWQPQTVYHAAAYKHVPLVEHNPVEGVKNNVMGTFYTAKAAGENNVRDFVLISTDKAVRPTNIMGASKRLAEMVLQGLASTTSHGYATKFSMVRFGNVLGSSGSVVPLFRQQIKNGGPITITHPEITRYFMTIPEAAQLVIQAGAMAAGGDVFVLDMGDPVRILDLAHRMISLSGLTVKSDAYPGGDIDIVVTGMRPGEKLYEELLIGDNPQPTQHPRIMKAQEQCLPWSQMADKIALLDVVLGLNDVAMLRKMLADLVAGYRPAEDIVDWLHLEYLAEVAEVPPAGVASEQLRQPM